MNMNFGETTDAERMKATIYCLVLSEVPDKFGLAGNFLCQSVENNPARAETVFDLCCRLLCFDDAEFLQLHEPLCRALRLACPTFLTMAIDTNDDELLKANARGRFPELAKHSFREYVAGDTLALLRIEAFWSSHKFEPLMKNVGRFEALDANVVDTVFEILHSYKPEAKDCKDYNLRADKLMKLVKVWIDQLQSRRVLRKKLLLNQLYTRIVEKKTNPIMSSVLTVVEVEILNGLLSPVPIETVMPVVQELISWAKVWYFNIRTLLPPIIKLLTRLDNEGREYEYNQVALENCSKMLILVKLPNYRPLISIICHFYRSNSCPERLFNQTADNLLDVILSSHGKDDSSLTLNLTKSLDELTRKYPQVRPRMISLLCAASGQRSDLSLNFAVNESPKGIWNTGNTCYANSVIQCLFYTTEFRNKVLLQKPKGSQNVLAKLQQLFALLKFSSFIVIYPDEVQHSALRPPYFVKDQQEDGFLYLSYILDMMKEQELKALGLKDDEMADVKKETSSVPALRSQFIGPLTMEQMKLELEEAENEVKVKQEPEGSDSERQIKKEPEDSSVEMQDCNLQTCKAMGVKQEAERSLRPTTNNNIPDESGANAADDETPYQTLSQDVFGGYQQEKYSCHGCGYNYEQTKRTTAICLAIPDRGERKSTVSELLEAYYAPVIFQDSERYECRGCHAKVDSTCRTKMVTAPKCLVLCLKRFYYDVAAQRTLKITTEVGIDDELRLHGHDFRIYATVVHTGVSASQGHYYSLVNTENGLMRLDDSQVVTNARPASQMDTPYILFYQRTDCRVDDQDVDFEQLDASLKSFVKVYKGRSFMNVWSGPKNHQPPPSGGPPPPPPSSCGGGSGLSSNRMVC